MGHRRQHEPARAVPALAGRGGADEAPKARPHRERCPTAAKRAWANASAYHATKWGLLGFSHALHAELRPHGIRVCAVVAGGMRTPFLLDRFPDLDQTKLQDPANVAETIKHVLLQPPGTAIAEVMVLPTQETSWP
jgi:NADP-dependent 3-hydroxy acid dehydrogenase YdfG